jgi:hypothetical protein
MLSGLAGQGSIRKENSMKVFLAFAFRESDKALVDYVDQLVTSHLMTTLTGEGLGGEALTPAVQQRIDDCDALIGLLTRRDQTQHGKFTTHQWVLDELGYARNRGKRAIALVETGVDPGGMNQPNEYIPLDRANPLPALVALSQSLGVWRAQTGRLVKVQLLPRELARKVGSDENGIRCSHRLWSRGKTGAWVEVKPVPEGGGTFIWIEGVKDEDLIQIKVEGDGRNVWQSVAVSQWIQIPLTAGGGK